MAKFKNVNGKIQVVGTQDQFKDSIAFYNKKDANSVVRLGFGAENGDVVMFTVDSNGNSLEDLERFEYGEITSPSSSDLEDLIDTLNSYIDDDSVAGTPIQVGVAVTDELSNISTGTAKVTLRIPRAMTLSDVRASVNTAPTGADIQVDINEDGVSILSTVISIDDGDETSEDSATPPVISDTGLADDAEITIDIDQVGSTISGKGLKVWLIGEMA